MKLKQNIEKFELYILSLWLLFVLITILTVDIPICFGEKCSFIGWSELIRKNIAPTICISLIITGIFLFIRFNYRVSGSKTLPMRIVEIEDTNYEHLTFLATYIIPLISIDLSDSRYLLVLTIVLITIGIIYVKTDKFYANPTLAILGYRLYKVTLKTRTNTRKDIIVITRDRLSDSDQIRTIDLDEKVCFGRVV